MDYSDIWYGILSMDKKHKKYRDIFKKSNLTSSLKDINWKRNFVHCKKLMKINKGRPIPGTFQRKSLIEMLGQN